MSFRSHLATATAGTARWGLRRVLKRNGGVLPGSLALHVDPQLLRSLATTLDASVVVTGTNGKTTTTNLIADAVAAAGKTAICNRAGNNMEAGIAGALLEGQRALKRTERGGRIGVFECDELYTVRVLPKIKPTFFVLLNLFRDQLDRYGEIDHTQDVIAQALTASPATTLIFNADDPLCAAVAARVPNPTLPFGIEGATDTETTRISESRFCAKCNAPLSYEYVQYGQLGSWRCPSCGWKRPALARWAEHVELGCGGYAFDLVFGDADGDGREARTHLETKYNGLYMVYNVMAACFAATALGAPASRFQQTLDTYVPAGGRMASWRVSGREVMSNLAKNPVGFDRQIQQIKTSGGRLVAFYLNDNDADGHDVSWIWDVDFERIADTPGLVAFAGGTRAHDMQVRLKYAGIEAALVKDIAGAIRGVREQDTSEALWAVANYTAFPPLVKELEALERTGVAAEAQPAADGDVEAATDADKRCDTGTAPDGGSACDDIEARGTTDAGNGETTGRDSTTLARPVRIVHLYPDALNLYGDGGNAIVLAQRCAWRGIPYVVDEVKMGEELDLTSADIVLMGGGADRDQLAVARELLSRRDEIKRFVDDGGTMLAICGSYQLLGNSYYMGDEKLDGLGVLDIETVRGEGRLIGNVAVQTDLAPEPFVGFENHGGRTRLSAKEQPLGHSIVDGTGNNGEDGCEGTLHDGVVGTYLHGPALSKNPALADWLLTHALERRVSTGDTRAAALLPLAPLDDACERAAHDAAMQLL